MQYYLIAEIEGSGRVSSDKAREIMRLRAYSGKESNKSCQIPFIALHLN
jgi:hypothetical protein